MKISIFPDKTRAQTLKPYCDLEKTYYRAVIMLVTEKRGVERETIQLRYYDANIDDVWLRIHTALVRAICELKHIHVNTVTHIFDSIVPDRNNTLSPRMSDAPKKGLFRI